MRRRSSRCTEYSTRTVRAAAADGAEPIPRPTRQSGTPKARSPLLPRRRAGTKQSFTGIFGKLEAGFRVSLQARGAPLPDPHSLRLTAPPRPARLPPARLPLTLAPARHRAQEYKDSMMELTLDMSEEEFDQLCQQARRRPPPPRRRSSPPPPSTSRRPRPVLDTSPRHPPHAPHAPRPTQVLGAVHLTYLTRQEKLKLAFQHLDLDGSGELDMTELQARRPRTRGHQRRHRRRASAGHGPVPDALTGRACAAAFTRRRSRGR